MFYELTIFLTFVEILHRPVSASVKHLRYNTNWSDPNNWSLGRVPDGRDKIIFSEDFGDLAVLLPDGDTSFLNLVLPFDGVLLFPRSGKLKSGSKGHFSDFFTEENEFLRNDPLEWLDPKTWILENEKSLIAVPHTERVPCRHDIVELPGNASFGLILPRWPVSVAGITFGDKNVGQMAWEYIVDASDGGKMFFKSSELIKRSELVKIQGELCRDPTGCPCSSARTEPNGMNQLICRYVVPSCETDGPPPCLDPVKPHGHCCDVCGAYLLLKYDVGIFRINRLKRHLQNYLDQEELTTKILTHISKIENDMVQIVLMDREEYTEDSVTTAYSVQQKLQTVSQLGIRSVTLIVAGAPSRIVSWARVAAPVFGSLLFAIIVFSSILLLYGGWSFLSFRGINDRAFIFARFENTDTETENVQVIAQEYETPTNQAFHNPMYDQKSTVSSAPSAVYSELQKQDTDTLSSQDKDCDETLGMTMVNVTSQSAEK